MWTLIQPFFTGWLLFGRDMFVVWLDLLDEGHRLLGLNASAAIWIILALVVLRLVVGGLSGWLAWNVGHLLHARLTETPTLPTES